MTDSTVTPSAPVSSELDAPLMLDDAPEAVDSDGQVTVAVTSTLPAVALTLMSAAVMVYSLPLERKAPSFTLYASASKSEMSPARVAVKATW